MRLDTRVFSHRSLPVRLKRHEDGHDSLEDDTAGYIRAHFLDRNRILELCGAFTHHRDIQHCADVDGCAGLGVGVRGHERADETHDAVTADCFGQ